MRILTSMQVFFPYSVEKRIHRWFADKRTRPYGAGRQAGSTEYFQLGRADKLKVYVYLYALYVLHHAAIFLASLLLVYGLSILAVT